MQNPFEIIDTRLKSIEALNKETNNFLRELRSPAPEVGGIEVAQEVTRLSKPRIYALVSARGIPHSKRGNKLYFNRAELIAWVERGRRNEGVSLGGLTKSGRSQGQRSAQ